MAIYKHNCQHFFPHKNTSYIQVFLKDLSQHTCLHTKKKKKQQEKTKNNPKKPQTATTTKAEITFFGFYLAMEKQYFVQKNMY